MNLPKSRAEAVELGVTRYFNGKPCPQGHIAPRAVRNCGCTECHRIKSAQWSDANPEMMQAARDAWEAANPERNKEAKRAYAYRAYHEDPVAANERSKKWREENRQENNRKRREKRAANREAARELDRLWRLANPDKVKATRKKSYKKRREDPAVRLNASMATGIRHSLANGAKGRAKWETLVGYTVKQLIAHLERKFKPGMTWENYGEWEIDHKIPLAAHNFETPQDTDFHRAWSLKNLQPLWKVENIVKGKRLEKPFQPSLMLRPANDNSPATDGATNAA